MTEPRSIEETERDADVQALQHFLDLDNPYLGEDQRRIMRGQQALDRIVAERDSLITRVSELEREAGAAASERDVNGEAIMLVRQHLGSVGVKAAFVDDVAAIAATRIESLVGEREELREALRKIAEDGYLTSDEMRGLARRVLSSRETTDSTKELLSDEELHRRVMADPETHRRIEIAKQRMAETTDDEYVDGGPDPQPVDEKWLASIREGKFPPREPRNPLTYREPPGVRLNVPLEEDDA